MTVTTQSHHSCRRQSSERQEEAQTLRDKTANKEHSIRLLIGASNEDDRKLQRYSSHHRECID